MAHKHRVPGRGYDGNFIEDSISSALPTKLQILSLDDRAFMRQVVANFDNEWEMSSGDVDAAIAILRGGKAT